MHTLLYTRQDGSSFKTNEKQLQNMNLHNFKGWSCFAPTKELVIRFNGDIYATNCDQAPYIGNTMTDSITAYQNPIVCELDECRCLADIRTDKKSHNQQLSVLNDKYDYLISWFPTDQCNFDCTYCPPYLHRKTDKWHEVRKKSFERLLEFCKDKTIHLDFLGGEPTLDKNIVTWVYELKKLNKNNYITITTNGSRSLNYLHDLAKYSELFFSVHLHQPKLYKLADKICSLSLEFGINVELMTPPGKLKESGELARYILEKSNIKNINLSMNRLTWRQQTNFNYHYSDKELKLIESFNQQFT